MKRSPSLNFFDVNRFHPVADRLKGCNALLPNKALLAAQLTVPESNIKNLRYDTANNQMTWHSVNDYQLIASRFSMQSSEPFQNDLAQAIQEFESSKMTGTGNNGFCFFESEIKVLKLTNYVSIPNSGLRSLEKIQVLELPLLEDFDSLSLLNLATQSDNPVSLNFPLLDSFSSGITGKFTFLQSSFSLNNADNTIYINRWQSQSTLPFPQTKLTNAPGGSFFRDMFVFNQALDLPQITELFTLCFINNYVLPSIELVNATSIGSGFLGEANAVLLIDIRRCTTLDTSAATITNVPVDGIINANIALQDYNGTGVHPRIAYLITRNWTVNYFDI